MKTPAEKHIESRAKFILREAEILKSKNGHDFIDITELKRMRDEDFLRMRRVGETTVEFIANFRKAFDWI